MIIIIIINIITSMVRIIADNEIIIVTCQLIIMQMQPFQLFEFSQLRGDAPCHNHHHHHHVMMMVTRVEGNEEG